MNKLFLTIICASFSFGAWSQFIDATLEMGTPLITDDPWFGHGVCLVDVNQDGWDDVTCCTFSNGIIVYENTATGWLRRNVVSSQGNAKCAVWGDFDRDGDLDLFVTHRYGNMRLYRNDGNWSFVDVSASAGLAEFPILATWGACWEDYNRDGWLDLFVVNYDASANAFNRCLKNNGDGTFTDMASALSVQGGGTFSFMPSFFRANNDAYNDLMVCVDFLPSDRLFLGNSEGNFTDASNVCGLNFMLNNMTTSPGDFDKDGDFDLYLTNTPGTGSFLYLNNGSAFFSNAPSFVGANINAWTWGAAWLDFNNDRNLDLVTASQSTNGLSSLYLLRNNGGAFQDITPDIFKFIPNSNYAVCSGDVNRDGFPDVYLNVEDGGYNRLFRNTQAGNNYVKLELEGVQSNIGGIGTFVEAYVEGTKIIHQLRGGEQYLSQNSQHLIIPLKSAIKIDSLVLNWPSGQIDKYFNVTQNKHYHLIEGNTSPVHLISSLDVLCNGSTTSVSAVNGNLVNWNSGQIAPNIEISNSSFVSGIQADSRNIYSFTDTLQLQFMELDSVDFEITSPACLTDSLAQVCLLSDSVFFQAANQSCLPNLHPGIYVIPIVNRGCADVLNLEIPSANLPEITYSVENATCLNNYLGGIAITDSIWHFSSNDVTQNLSPGNYQFQVFSGWCTSEISTEILQAESFNLNVEITNPTCFTNPNTGLIALNSDSLTWNTLILETDTLYQGFANAFDSLSGGQYTMISESLSGCMISQLIHLETPNSWSLQAAPTPIACSGENTGSVELVVAGNSAAMDVYLTSDQGIELNTTSMSISNLPAGNYSVSCTDTLGCLVFSNFEITEPSPLICQIDSTNWIGAFPFELNVLSIGGTPPYAYQWSNGCADSSCLILESGEVSIVVTDTNGCLTQMTWGIPTQLNEFEQNFFTISGHEIRFSSPRLVKIYNLTGQVLFEGYANCYRFENQGIYFLDVKNSSMGNRVFKVKI